MGSTLVGARELKVRLGSYLRRVRQGQTLVVTDRGRPVAELRPMPRGGRDAVLARLEAEGVVTRPTKRALAPFRPIELEKVAALSDAVLEDRNDRF
jgi:antitoxin (DNA-binding transcriptional repressor) of toxin-antitoxin stability system